MKKLKQKLREIVYGDIASVSLYSLSKDFQDYFDRRKKGKLDLPPWSLRNSVGQPDQYEEAGLDMLNHLVKTTDILNKKVILDVGCGCGRVAIFLARNGFKGRYWGMDINARQIAWARKNISTKYPNFHFYQADLYNKLYNKHGKILVKDYLFPFVDEVFDVIFFTSVYTHLVPEDTNQFLQETKRLLKKNGLAFMTFFLLNSTQQKLRQQNIIDFKYGKGIYKSSQKNLAEAAIAYDEKYILNILNRIGLKVVHPILYGSWSGRPKRYSSQDIIIASKRQ